MIQLEFSMNRKQTQLEMVKDFIKSNGKVFTWDIQNFAIYHRFMGESGNRHARTLQKQGKIEHPVENGTVNKHAWSWIKD